MQPRWMLWVGRVHSAIPVLVMVSTGAFSFTRSPEVLEGMRKFGYQENTIVLVGTLEVLSAVVYAIPQTAVLGAILMTAYLGGAVATHVRIADPGWPMAVIMASLVWAGLWLREPRLRALLPRRKK